MKTRIATLSILLGLFITATALASEPVPASKAVSSSVSNLIDSELEYPEFAIKDKLEDVVVLEIKIEKDGSLNVVTANSLYDNMRKHAVEAVENIDTDKYAQYAGQTVLVKVTYDLTLY